MDIKLRRVVVWLVANTTLALLFYFAYFEHVEGARNVVNAAIALLAIGAVIAGLGASLDPKHAIQVPPCSVPLPLDVAWDSTALLVIAWVGAWPLFVMYVLMAVGQHVAWIAAKEAKEKLKKGQQHGHGRD